MKYGTLSCNFVVVRLTAAVAANIARVVVLYNFFSMRSNTSIVAVFVRVVLHRTEIHRGIHAGVIIFL